VFVLCCALFARENLLGELSKVGIVGTKNFARQTGAVLNLLQLLQMSGVIPAYGRWCAVDGLISHPSPAFDLPKST
jgi:hypothetical protein